MSRWMAAAVAMAGEGGGGAVGWSQPKVGAAQQGRQGRQHGQPACLPPSAGSQQEPAAASGCS